MVKVTQTARDAAKPFLDRFLDGSSFADDRAELEQAFAAAEQRGQAAMRDKAAKVARGMHSDVQPSSDLTVGWIGSCEHIATAIESLPTEGEG